MSPAMFGGNRNENLKARAKKIKAYTNNKLPGYWRPWTSRRS